MSTIASIRLSAEEFALHETFAAVPDGIFEIERVVAYEPDHILPFVWVTCDGTDQGTLDEALAGDPSIENVTKLAAFDDEWLYQMEWVENIHVMLHVLLEQEATVLTAVGRNDEWYLRLLFPDRGSVSATYEFCEDEGLTFTVENIHRLDNERRDRYGLTEAQHEMLVTAVENGYFDIPQNCTLDDLAAELDISHQALSERLHRGHKALIENTLLDGRMGR